jgi:hypothetical protein
MHRSRHAVLFDAGLCHRVQANSWSGLLLVFRTVAFRCRIIDKALLRVNGTSGIVAVVIAFDVDGQPLCNLLYIVSSPIGQVQSSSTLFSPMTGRSCMAWVPECSAMADLKIDCFSCFYFPAQQASED